MKNILLPVPPRDEQDQIVRYLDWQVSKINRLIAAKRKQIDLLKEQKQRTIWSCSSRGGTGRDIFFIKSYESVRRMPVPIPLNTFIESRAFK